MTDPRLISSCPGCGARLQVRELGCPECGIALRGDFRPCEFCSLPQDQLAFLRLFISRRGNLREVERELGLSYPTVRARLDDLLRALGYPTDAPSVRDRYEHRRRVLDDLKSQRITADQAVRELKA
ncbi:MAG: DUF2089 domain-containing protein [Armatimonadetes bacterium]|nr:DUF2089 domain-containing protein [Armatimonadota bacterium]